LGSGGSIWVGIWSGRLALVGTWIGADDRIIVVRRRDIRGLWDVAIQDSIVV